MKRALSAHRFLRICVSVLFILLQGCQQGQVAPEEMPTATSPTMPTASDFSALKTPQLLYLDPELSRAWIEVRREGLLARLGHNHMVRLTNIAGIIQLHPEPRQNRFFLSIPVTELVMDSPADRAMAGPEFSSKLSARQIADTRQNTLGPKVLNAEKYPFIRVYSIELDGKLPILEAKIALELAGITTGPLATKIHLQLQENRIIASGTLKLSQQEIGITPFSTLGGALKVQDQLLIHYRLCSVTARFTKQGSGLPEISLE